MTKCDYWVVDGDVKTFDVKDTLRDDTAAEYINYLKCWRLNSVTREDPEFIKIKKLGLSLQPIVGTEKA